MTQAAGSAGPPLQVGIRGLRIIRYLPHFVRLYWRLLRDGRVSLWPKLLLVLALIYVASPLDLIPDIVPGFGAVDDLVLLIVVCRLFVYMCPRAVVREHVRRIDGTA
jgi:uncharacterized membrane protein YkvA (DUF1232 family)